MRTLTIARHSQEAKALAALAAIITSSMALAAPVEGIRAAATEPLAVRGGVLMLPLTAARPGDRWPASLDLALEDGRKIEGVVAWIEPVRTLVPHWTAEPWQFAAREIAPGDDSSLLPAGASWGPYLVAWLPQDGRGAITLADHRMQPRWLDPAPGASNVAENARTLEAALAPDRPDPDSPFAHWRWALLAHEMDMLPPPTDRFGRVREMIAEHEASLWRIGLSRLAAGNAAVASRIRGLLTQRAIDLDRPFASWIAEPARTSSLLAIVLDFSSGNAAVARRAAEYLDEIEPVLVWAHGQSATHVEVAAVNRSAARVPVEFVWRGVGGSALVVEIEPGALQRVDMLRPPPPEARAIGLAAPPEPALPVLLVRYAGLEKPLTFGPRVIEVLPPGVALGPLRPPLTLAEACAGATAGLDPARATAIHIRRRHRRWEVFFDCRRPPPPPPERTPDDRAIDRATLTFRRDFTETTGLEAVTLLIGPESARGGPRVVLTATESGEHRLFAGLSDDTLEIHRQSYADRWYCRVVLPDSWLQTVGEAPIEFGFQRTHGTDGAVELGPGVALPWRPEPARVALDLSGWRDTP